MNIKAIIIIYCFLLTSCTAIAIRGGGVFKNNFKYEKVSRYPPDVVKVEFDSKPIYFVADDSGTHIGWCGYGGMFIGPILPIFPLFPMPGNMCNNIGFRVTLANLDKNIHMKLKYRNKVYEPYSVKFRV